VAPADAAYGTIASIALHGVRLAELGLGDIAAVVGLGLVGQLALDLLAASGCLALGIDPDPQRVALAREAGFWATTDPADLQAEAGRHTDGRGADGVLVAAASRSAAPLATAIAVARERAVVCIVGDVAIESARAPLFAKELRLVVSRSYGPGRYDPKYEEAGIDYPAGYVRWTEGRNLAEALRLMANGKLKPSRLTTHTFTIDDAPSAYALLESDEPSLGIVLSYPEPPDAGTRSMRRATRRRRLLKALGAHRPRVGVIGAGTFARGVLLPALARHADITAVATSTGISARASADRFGAALATTDTEAVIAAPDVDAVLIATRHDTHADYATAALRAGKHVFVEKPLGLSESQLAAVEEAAADASGVLVVGFNRRFAPLALQLREALGDCGPLLVNYRINAGRLPRSHWTHDPQVGGGRIVGEGCHFIDFAAFLTGSQPVHVAAAAVTGTSEPREDCTAATFTFADGSVAQVVYSALGDSALPKERIEVLGEAGAGVLDDFRKLRLYRRGREEVRSGRRDKGHAAEMEDWTRACRDGRQPWPVADMTAVMRATFAWRDAVARPLELRI
jgi:predicted dehydrogenase